MRAAAARHQAVQRRCSVPGRRCSPPGEVLAQSVIALRPFGQSIEQRPQNRTSAAGDDRHGAAFSDLAQHRACEGGVVAGVEDLVRFQQVNQVMGCRRAVGGVLAVPMLQAAVKLEDRS